jgi:hypothetical protein
MFINHREFEQVPDETIIWRYMPFDKFESLLLEKSLFFTKISYFHKIESDSFEGRYNQISIDNFYRSRLNPGETLESIKNDENSIIRKNADALFNRLNNKLHELTLVNCWQINEVESVSMWKLYSNYENGIAIQTTYGRLKDSFQFNEKNVYGGKISYVNKEKHITTYGNTMTPFMEKRLFFIDENELRLLIDISNESKNFDWTKERFDNGRLISCDLSTLIESVYISPKCKEGFKMKVQQLIKDLGGLNIEVKSSKI